MQKSSNKQNLVYKQNIQKEWFQPEKVKYAKHLESEVYTALGVRKGEYAPEEGKRIPLGRVVSQLEMTNPIARR